MESTQISIGEHLVNYLTVITKEGEGLKMKKMDEDVRARFYLF